MDTRTTLLHVECCILVDDAHWDAILSERQGSGEACRAGADLR